MLLRNSVLRAALYVPLRDLTRHSPRLSTIACCRSGNSSSDSVGVVVFAATPNRTFQGGPFLACQNMNSSVLCRRLSSSSSTNEQEMSGSKTNKNDSSSAATGTTNEVQAKPTVLQRFKNDFKRYWYLMLPIHITTSFGCFLCFYYLSKAGVSPVPLMDYIGIPGKYVDPIRDSTASHVAVGYAGYKLIAPFRYVTTIALTGVAVRVLGSRGLLRPMLTFEEFKALLRTKLKNAVRG